MSKEKGIYREADEGFAVSIVDKISAAKCS